MSSYIVNPHPYCLTSVIHPSNYNIQNGCLEPVRFVAGNLNIVIMQRYRLFRARTLTSLDATQRIIQPTWRPNRINRSPTKVAREILQKFCVPRKNLIRINRRRQMGNRWEIKRGSCAKICPVSGGRRIV